MSKLKDYRVAETGHRPVGVGVSRDVGRTKRPIYCVSLIPRIAKYFNDVSSLRIMGALYLDLFDQPVKK